MGSRNKVLLASLVSMVMMLSFAIGLVPSSVDSSITGASAAAPVVAITADGATPAGDSLTLTVGESVSFSALGANAAVDWSLASNGSAELVDDGDSVTVVALAPGESGLYLSSADGADLVNVTVVAAAEDKALETVRILTPANGSRVFIQAGASNVPYAVTSATNDPDDTGIVNYTLNDSPLGGSIKKPYAVNIPDITDFVTGASATNTLVAAATTYAAYAGDKDTVTATSNFSVIEGNFDDDGNGLPDNPFALDLGPGDSWVGTRDGTTRQVVIVPLVDNFNKLVDFNEDGATASITSQSNPDQVVSAFAPAGLLAEDEIGYLILVVADTLEDLLDDGANGDILNFPGDGLVAGARFAEVSIIVSADGGTSFAEIVNPLPGNVLVQMDGLATVAGDEVRAYTYNSTITQPPVFVNADATGEWATVASLVETGSVTASTNTLSVFAPFSTPGAANITGVLNVTPGSSLVGTSQARANGGDNLVISVDNVTPADSVALTIGGLDVVPTNASATATGTDYEVTALASVVQAVPTESLGVDVSIEVNGDIDIAASALTYVGPTVNDITPTTGPAGGGTAVTITGEALTGTSVTIGGNPLVSPTVTAGQITGTTPAGNAGTADVVVAYSNNFVGVLADGFVYVPGPAEIAVSPSAVFDDGGYTVAVNAIMGTQFVDPASGIDNQVFFADPNEDPDPSSDLSAAEVVFVDDTRLSVLTPSIDALTKQSAVATLYNLYHTTTAYTSGAKQNGGISNLVPFVFVDVNAAAFTIDAIDPNIGPASGGNTVQLTGEFGDLEELDTGPPVPPTPEGQQVFFGTEFEAGAEIEFAPLQFTGESGAQRRLTLYHNNAFDTKQAGAGPAAISFTVNWDPAVIAIPSPGAVQTAPLLGQWYGKQVALNFQNAANGQLAVVISGGQTFTPDFQAVSTEITTFDNQLPEIVDAAGTDQQNPFPLLSINFNLVGANGTSTPLSITNLTMADRDAAPLPSQGALNTTVAIGAAAKQGQGSDLFNVAFGTQAATVQQAGEVNPDGTDRIDITAPAVDQAAAAAAFEAGENFSVDVRVESVDFDPFASDGSETLFAISRAASIYTNGKSIDGGYTYQPGTVRQIANFSPIGTWVFGAQELTIEGQGFTEDQTIDPVVTFEVVDDNNETVSLLAELVSVSDTEIVVVVPVLEADVENSGRMIDATINVEFEDGTETAEGFTYVKWNVTIGTSSPREYGGSAETGDITTNSFFFSAADGFDAGEAGLVFDGAAELKNLKESTNPITGEIVPPSATTGTLRIPPLPPAAMAGKSTDRVFGILRVTQVEELFGIGPLPDDPEEGELPFPGNKFETIFNFDLHLYEGQAPYDEFYVKYDVEDLPDVPSLVYNVPASVGLTRAEIATGRVATWSRPTTFDYTFNTQSATIPAVTASEKAERLAAPRPNTYSLEAVLITEDTLPANENEAPTAVRARIFNLGAGSFALRRDAAPGVDDIEAYTTSGTDIVVSTSGGDEVSISGRNIYWATNLFAVPAGTVPAQSNPFGPPVERGVDEDGVETLVFISPALSQGTYDMHIEVPTSTGSKQTILVPVQQGRLIVQADGKFPFPIGIIPALLGGLVALLGILAGGDSSSSGGPCFIATAAYGTPMATEIEVLRTVRDSYMLSNPLGAAFVDTYYRVSPALADVVAQSPVLASVIRLLLTPVLFAAKMLVSMPAVSIGLLGMGMLMAALRRRFVRGM